MHQVALLSALFAAAALAEPVHQGHRHFHKRQDVVETDYAMATVYQTVTQGADSSQPTQAAAPQQPPQAQQGQGQGWQGNWGGQNGGPGGWTSTWVKTYGGDASSSAPPSSSSTTPASSYVAPSSSASSSAAASSSASSGGYGSTGVDYVDQHNQNRQKHGAVAMQHDAGLEARAQAIADNCPGGDKDDGQEPKVGSNWAGGTNLDMAGAMSMWYGEEGLYAQYSNDYKSEPNVPSNVEALHFSQVIWNASTSVGCGQKACSGGNQVTCLYYPQGNFAMMNNGVSDSYVQNVFPPTSGNS